MLFKNKHIEQQSEDLTQDFTQDNDERNEDSSQKPVRKIIDGKMYDSTYLRSLLVARRNTSLRFADISPWWREHFSVQRKLKVVY